MRFWYTYINDNTPYLRNTAFYLYSYDFMLSFTTHLHDAHFANRPYFYLCCDILNFFILLFNRQLPALNSHRILPNVSVDSDINDLLLTLRLNK